MKHPHLKPSNKIIHHAVIGSLTAASLILDPLGMKMKLNRLPVTLSIILNILSLAAFSYDHFEHGVILALEACFCLALHIAGK